MNFTLAVLASAIVGMGGVRIPRELREHESTKPKQPTKYDIERIAKARAKMERKAAGRREAKEGK